MFIPLTNKISWRNPPFITIFIILVNVFVFSIVQSDDNENEMKAIQYYWDSGLAGIEFSYYADYLNTTEGTAQRPDFRAKGKISRETFWFYYNKLMRDDRFLGQLLNDRIITPDNGEYQTWKGFRREFEALEAKVVSNAYGFTPSKPRMLTAFTAMFLHGSFGHLIGNMIFLWLVSCILEYGCGRIFYLLIYFLGGLSAGGLYTLFNLNSYIPCIGASGAISGLMGAYAVLYGKTKIKVFYTLGFYFNYTNFPAILLLPIWIGTELFSQLFFGVVSNTAYMAHVGGLAGGGLLGLINLKFMKPEAKKIFDLDPKEKIPKLFEEALAHLKKLDLEEARPLILQILEINPDNREALIQLFNIDKLNPQHPYFQKTASGLFIYLIKNPSTIEDLHYFYKEYLLIAKVPKLHFDLLFRIATRFIANDYLQEAEQILAFLLRYRPVYAHLPMGLLNLGKALLRKGRADKAQKCFLLLSQKFPQAAESQTALTLYKRIR
jgi:membrane associated rhomboid family serine protease